MYDKLTDNLCKLEIESLELCNKVEQIVKKLLGVATLQEIKQRYMKDNLTTQYGLVN